MKLQLPFDSRHADQPVLRPGRFCWSKALLPRMSLLTDYVEHSDYV